MVVDRISTGITIKKQFNIEERIYYDKINQKFSNISTNNLLYELKFIIYHSCFSNERGHYKAFCKINNDWYLFDDLDRRFAIKKAPVLKDNKDIDFYPVILYYIKK